MSRMREMDIEREEAKNYIKQNPDKYFKNAKKKNTYVCPLCGNGTGKTGDGVCSKDGIHYKCFKCGFYGDIIDYIGAEYGINENHEKFKKAYEIYNITLETDTKKYFDNMKNGQYHKYSGLKLGTENENLSNQEQEQKKENVENTKISGQNEQNVGEVNTYRNENSNAVQNRNQNENLNSIQSKNENQNENEKTDYTNFFLQANKNIDKTDYLLNRGISKEVQNRFKIGYVENWKSPKLPNSFASQRLIIPTSKYSYLARKIETDENENVQNVQTQNQNAFGIVTKNENENMNINSQNEQKNEIESKNINGQNENKSENQIQNEQKNKNKNKNKDSYTKMKVGEVSIFNVKALTSELDTPIFVAEGEIDALSIIEAGAEAIALGGVSNNKKLIEILTKNKPKQPLVLCLDNDEAGERCKKNLETDLKELNIPYRVENIAKNYKDPNEALQADREAFISSIMHIKSNSKSEKDDYLDKNTAYYLQEFIDGISENANTKAVSTGFKELDNSLDGGLFEGLYIIGAISSLGKTTLVMQMADQIAQSGEDVLIFSLEMARNELISKSISRETLLYCEEIEIGYTNAKSNRGITCGNRYKNYTITEKNVIMTAMKKYSQYAKNIRILEGVGDIGTNQVREAVEKHILFTGKKPVVIIDYLQILAPASERATDKQNTDKAVLELKRISRDNKISVIGISSFNRESYTESVTMKAFKESGAIEYSSDVLIGLQLKGAGTKDFNETESKSKSPREIELKILKNRNGGIPKTPLEFNYYPIFNYFEEQKQKIKMKNQNNDRNYYKYKDEDEDENQDFREIKRR